MNYIKITKTAEFINKYLPEKPEIAFVLGTGLNEVLDDVKDQIQIPFSKGNLIYGNLYGKKVIFLQERLHVYEGHSFQDIAFPIHVMKFLGCKKLFIVSACGGLNRSYNKGDLMIITDHLNLMGGSPLVGKNDEKVGNRFPDMSNPYLIPEISDIHYGVYAAVLGPQLETKAEYRMLKILGVNAVGMSTVPEVIAAVHCGLEVFAVGVITDLCDPDNLKPVSIEEIVASAKEGCKKYRKLLKDTNVLTL